jgi:hypothetical protein
MAFDFAKSTKKRQSREEFAFLISLACSGENQRVFVSALGGGTRGTLDGIFSYDLNSRRVEVIVARESLPADTLLGQVAVAPKTGDLFFTTTVGTSEERMSQVWRLPRGSGVPEKVGALGGVQVFALAVTSNAQRLFVLGAPRRRADVPCQLWSVTPGNGETLLLFEKECYKTRSPS